ncbi:MAG: glucoamylase family protein [Bacteroidales bacterium]|nr:glucoamylase family protein [Bacteroidales bacterium]
MIIQRSIIALLLILLSTSACKKYKEIPPLLLESAYSGPVSLLTPAPVTDVPFNQEFEITFSYPVDIKSVQSGSIKLSSDENQLPLTLRFENGNRKIIIEPSENLIHYSKCRLDISSAVKGAENEKFDGFTANFYTELDTIPKFPEIPDQELLTLIQKQTFRYFWDFGHPTSGMARERNTSGDIVTSGGTGFGIMAIPVAVNRGFISREEGTARIEKIVDFLKNADRFHGAWSHWLNGSTGDAIPFSPKDNGGDLVETAFLIQGLLTVRQFLDPAKTAEVEIIDKINILWQEVEWDWYTRNDEKKLYWHWSPEFNWEMNMPVQGYNEALIIYVLAASSPTHPIDAEVYHQGWSRNGDMVNGQSYYNIVLPLGFEYGGPLFFAHYSFLGLDPRNLQDSYANYWEQNVHHSQINHAYCKDNPLNYVGYSDIMWGLTASDNHNGYSAHSPTNDLGVITPTAAISSLPYTPEYSMEAIRFFYYSLGEKLWGEYGFYDAINITEGWVANSYLAIDQGPIIVMIENYRSGMLWELFMSCPEVPDGLKLLGFQF